MKGYLMSLDIAEKFFKRCAEQEAVTLEERLAIMSTLLHEENIRILKEKQIGDIIKGRNVIKIDNKDLK